MVKDHQISLPASLIKELDPTQLAVYCRLLCDASADMQVLLNSVELAEDMGISQGKLKEALSQLCRTGYFVKGSLITIYDSGFSSERVVQVNRVEVTK